jgi:membrane protease subunit HflK
MSSTNQWDPVRDLRRYSEDIKAFMKLGAILAVVVVLVWLVMSSVYTVQAKEEALILRFGKDAGVTGPGLHFKLPFGIDRIKKVAVKEVKRQEFGFRTEQAGVETIYARPTPRIEEEGRILTGDLNILMVNWVVRYRVENVRDYYFSLRSPDNTIRDVSEAIMRQVVGDSSVDEVLTFDRERIQLEAQRLIQEKLDRYGPDDRGAGIEILDQGGVRLKDVSPPEEVKDAFNAVNKARQQKETIINQAEAERNSKIPEAKGKKNRVISEAQGYATQRVNEAQGDVARFEQLLSVHQKNPSITEKRLYLETMGEVLQKVPRKHVLDPGASDVLKFLNLKDAQTKGGQQQ